MYTLRLIAPLSDKIFRKCHVKPKSLSQIQPFRRIIIYSWQLPAEICIQLYMHVRMHACTYWFTSFYTHCVIYKFLSLKPLVAVWLLDRQRADGVDGPYCHLRGVLGVHFWVGGSYGALHAWVLGRTARPMYTRCHRRWPNRASVKSAVQGSMV